MQKMIITLIGKRIGCTVLKERKNSVVLQPEGKKTLFKGTATIILPKKK